MPPGIAIEKTTRAAGIGRHRAADRRAVLGRIGSVKLSGWRRCRLDRRKRRTRAANSVALFNLDAVQLFERDEQPPSGTRPPVTPVPDPEMVTAVFAAVASRRICESAASFSGISTSAAHPRKPEASKDKGNQAQAACLYLILADGSELEVDERYR